MLNGKLQVFNRETALNECGQQLVGQVVASYKLKREKERRKKEKKRELESGIKF